MLCIANLLPPEEIEVEGPAIYLPVVQVVLIAIGTFAVWLYAHRAAQLDAIDAIARTYNTRPAPSAGCAALGVNSMWSLCGPWL